MKVRNSRPLAAKPVNVDARLGGIVAGAEYRGRSRQEVDFLGTRTTPDAHPLNRLLKPKLYSVSAFSRRCCASQ
jgi:hypothetical protein